VLNWIKWLVLGAIALIALAAGAAYITLQLSLPTLDGNNTSIHINGPTALARDEMGHAVITAQDKLDAAYALGFAHAQDRYFQMDLQRRSASGELSQWVGDVALNIDKSARFHQFSARAKAVFDALPLVDKKLLVSYSHGVNAALEEFTVPPFEYVAAGVELLPWRPSDSILVAYSMYLDLQGGQIELDLARTALQQTYGDALYQFITQPSHYQAALDASEVPVSEAPIPPYPDTIFSLPDNSDNKDSHTTDEDASTETAFVTYNAAELPDIGSNNWAVTGKLTATGSGLLANDMHLGLRVPIIWYRTQLNYTDHGQAVALTGVSLPGLPGIIVGTNNHIAWGFTNANLDNLDWIKLDESAPTTIEAHTIKSANGPHTFQLETSEYGPVKQINGQRYALNWVAHHPFAVNLSIMRLGTATNVDDAITVGKDIAIPTQNMVVVDAKGNASWLPAGAVMARTKASFTAIEQPQNTTLVAQRATSLPTVTNPDGDRIWTANARVISSTDLARLGDGGYALGARARQIRDRLFEKDTFSEIDFYAIQLDNHAQFLIPWQQLLTDLLQTEDAEFTPDLLYLGKWKECACEDSVGYTLVKHFRKAVIQQLFGELLASLDAQGIKSRTLLRGIEPAAWQLIHTQPASWLPEEVTSYDSLLLDAYRSAKRALLDTYSPEEDNMEMLRWGNVNTLTVKHPFAAQIPLIGNQLNMHSVEGFGDTYMPSVQSPTFGASERFFVSPGHLESAILTLPGGQSGHPLSPYFSKGFNDYATHAATPLLPGDIEHIRRWYVEQE